MTQNSQGGSSPPAYKYQKKALDQILSGKNLLIQAPTGAGKTRAALEPGIQGLYRSQDEQNRADYPPRIIYGVPMRVLATSFLEEYQEHAQKYHWEHEWYPTIQTGERPEDAQFESRVIFATVDQMLASFLCLPYGLPRRLGNINPGALIGSYLVFDEFHLYPQNEMMLTVLAMLKMLKDVSRFTLMTATFSQPMLKKLSELLGAEILANDPGKPLKEGWFKDVGNIQTQERTWQPHPDRLTAGRARELIGDAGRAMCICNTVDRAQQLYLSLRDKLPDHEVILLHSRFYRSDRREIEQRALNRLGKQTNPSNLERPFVLVATQVVEVGLDLSCDVLLSECAPAASLVQRAGRCARRENEAGMVHIFRPFVLNKDEEWEVNYAPYIDDGMEDICERTWEALNASELAGQVLRFPQEQWLIDQAHRPADEAFVASLDDSIAARIEAITGNQSNPDMGRLDKFIRENTSVPLYIHASPKDDDYLIKRPWRREAFSLSKGQLKRLFETASESPDFDGDFILWGGSEIKDDDPESSAITTYQWEPLSEGKEAFDKLWKFTAHPEAVSYSQDVGLRLTPGEVPAAESGMVREPHWEYPFYHAERYWEHIAGLRLAYTMKNTILDISNKEVSYTGLREELLYPLHRLCAALSLDLDPLIVERMLRLAMALHDVGKLNRPWQQWAKDWQEFYTNAGYDPELPLDDPAPLAHTTLDRNDREQRDLSWNFKHKPRGTHAVEGANAAYPVIKSEAGNKLLAAVTLAAIMNHHTFDASSCGEFAAVADARPAIEKGLGVFGFSPEESWTLAGQTDLTFERSRSVLSKAARSVEPAYHNYTPALLYYVFVRTLRLADQRSGAWWQKYKNESVNPLNQLEVS